MDSVLTDEKAAEIETVVRAAAAAGNGFAIGFFRAIRGLPRARKTAIIQRLAGEILDLAKVISIVQEGHDESGQPNQLG